MGINFEPHRHYKIPRGSSLAGALNTRGVKILHLPPFSLEMVQPANSYYGIVIGSHRLFCVHSSELP